jgi:hypothetical protein
LAFPLFFMNSTSHSSLTIFILLFTLNSIVDLLPLLSLLTVSLSLSFYLQSIAANIYLYLASLLYYLPHKQCVISAMLGETLGQPKASNSYRYLLLSISSMPTIYIFIIISHLTGVSNINGL